jgi:hypothetical protein
MLGVVSAGALGQNGLWTDAVGDAALRRTDTGNDGPLVPDAVVPDLVSVEFTGWTTAGASNPFGGSVDNSSKPDLFRLRIVVQGLVSPPGTLSPFSPAPFGGTPLYGTIEFDADDQKNSGGELPPIAKTRYLANVGRFGLRPAGSFGERAAVDGADLDTNFFSVPQYERTGGEFAFTLCGCFSTSVQQKVLGDADGLFEAGESWVVRGRFFERSQAFAANSAMFGGSAPGRFDPLVNVQWTHSTGTDRTTITLVFPVTNAGAAQYTGAPVAQPNDFSVLNQTSVEECLEDLIDGASGLTGVQRELWDDWTGRQADDFLNVREWTVTALIGTAYAAAGQDNAFVWSDTGFGEVFGDVNGDEVVDHLDAAAIRAFIGLNDGGASDADGTVNEAVAIPSFSSNFSMLDLNGDGVIGCDDVQAGNFRVGSGDPRGPADSGDLADFIHRWLSMDDACDVDGDGMVGPRDLTVYVAVARGACGVGVEAGGARPSGPGAVRR